MQLSRFAQSVLVMIAVAFLGGCTTYVAKVKKDDAYNKRLVETSVVWIPRTDIKTRVTRTAQLPAGVTPFISEKDKSDAQQATGELLTLFAKSAPDTISKSLAAERITIVQKNEAASTQLRIQPILSDTDCAPLGCQHSLWIEITLVDKTLNKIVWSASFKVGAPFPAKNDESVINSFASTLIGELRNSRLL